MITLAARLQTLVSLVQKGAIIADIGCDHGYVSAYLVENDVVKKAIAADVNEGPLKSCECLIKQMGLSNAVDIRLSDGLREIRSEECDTIIIAGMGGESIVSILEDCSFAKEKHLILQPMTHPECVRKYLYENDFTIKNDLIVSEGHRYYNVIDAFYDGKKPNFSEVDFYLGEISDFSNKAYFKQLLHYLQNKQKSGECYNDVIAILKEKL